MNEKTVIVRMLPILVMCACAAGEPPESTTAIEIGVLNGNIDSAGTRNQAVRLSTGCSGALITNSWVLTANHCVDYNTQNNGTVTVTYANSQTHTVTRYVRHPSNAGWQPPPASPEYQGIDVLLMKVDAPFTVNGSTSGFSRALYPFDSAVLNGQTIEIDGWGNDDWADSHASTTLRYAALPVESNGVFKNTVVDGVNVGDRVYYDNNNLANPSAGQLPLGGDSGAGLFINPSGTNYLAVVQAGSNRTTQAFGAATSTPSVRSWFDNALFETPVTVTEDMYSIPCVSSQGSGQLDVFWVNTARHLIYYQLSGGLWHAPVDLGTPSGVTLGGNKPASVSWSAGRIDVFVQATNNTVYQRYFTSGAWQPGWTTIQTNVMSAPAVSSWGPNRLDLFGVGVNGELRHSFYDNGWFMVWEDLGGVISGSPAAVSWGPNRIDVVVRKTDNSVYHRWWDGSSWGGYENLGIGSTFTAGPAISSFKAGRLDIFARGQNGNMFHRWYDNGWLNEWTDTGIAVPTAMAATSWGPGRIDVVSISLGSNLWKTSFPRE